MRPFDEILQKIDFTPENGLVRCDEPGENIDPGEFYYIHEKAKKLGVNAVLFRRKYNAENEIIDSQPVLFIFEKEDSFFDSQGHKDLQAKIWSAGEIEVYFIISKTRIDIFNARKPAEIIDQSSQTLSVKNLLLISEAIEKFNDQRFSAIVFGKGIFWEQTDFSNQLSEENAPFYRLLEYLMAVRRHLHTNQSIDLKDTIDKLLIISILVKFLEEIKDDNGKHTLRKIYKTHNITSFADALEKGICFAVLQELAPEFNGHIFNKFSDKEKQQIKHASLKLIADFLNATIDIDTQQTFLWEQYSFHHLPVELISAIYENFLPKEKGVVYTPPFLVNFLVDEIMPMKKASEYFSQNNYKVLDPSCGSGIFLVAAYKRMLQWWSINHYKEKNEIKFPDKKICQEILEQNIYGVDKHPTATLITVFSLTIALLDKLEPKEIWNNLKLNSLKDNIKDQDFFEWAAANANDKKFDLVIGNPPFNDDKGKSTHIIEPELTSKIGFKHKKVAGNKFALQFFEGGMALGKKVCLIIPANVLLYNKKAQVYREQIFQDFTIEKIIDFTHLREILFVKKIPKYSDSQTKKKKMGRTPVCVVLASSTKSEGNAIEHTVIKRIVAVEKKISFEIDHYDRHFVRYDWAIDPKKQFIWKTNLLGGGRLFHLIYRLSLLPTINNFITNKENEQNEWIYSVGYIIKHSKKKKLRADFITGKSTIKPKSFKFNGNFETEIENSEFFVETRTKELYTAPHIIFKLVVEKSKIPMILSDEYLCFNSSFVGIHAPLSDRDELYKIYERLHKNENISRLYRAFILATSSKSLVYHETSMVKEDIDNLPYPEDTNFLVTSLTEEILINDVLEYYIHLGKAITEDRDGRKLHEKVNKDQLEQFGKIFCQVINPMHAENDMSWQIGDVFQTPEKNFIIYQFVYGLKKQVRPFGIKESSMNDLDKILEITLLNDKENRAAIFTRVTRIYGSQDDYDYLILIKPTATRYWLNSIAIRDADDTIFDYYEAGY